MPRRRRGRARRSCPTAPGPGAVPSSPGTGLRRRDAPSGPAPRKRSECLGTLPPSSSTQRKEPLLADKDAIYDRVAGKAKETAGKVTGDKETETEGRLQNIEGKVAEKVGEVKDEVAEKADDVKDAVKGVAARFKKDE